MAAVESKGDFKDKQFEQNEVADKVVEQCEYSCSQGFFC